MTDGTDPDFKGRKVLVTGGLGFIGSNLARRLCDLGARVVVVDSLLPNYGGCRYNLAGYEDRIRVDLSDVRDAEAMRALVPDQDYLFNLAGQTSHMDSMTDPFTDLEINCRAQLSILEVCRAVNPGIKVVFASTRQLYGKPSSLPVDESHLLAPVDVNGINKMAGEWYHILYNNVHQIRGCSLRLTNTIGPRMRIKDARQTFIGMWVRRILEGRPFEVWDGEQLRDITYVDDVLDALLLAARDDRANGGIFNLGGERPVSLKELADLLVKANGGGEYAVREFPGDRKRIDIGSYYADDTRIRSTLGWAPRTSVEEALRKTLDYYRGNLERYL